MTDANLPDDLRLWPADPHALFGVGPRAGTRELRRAYVALIRRFKPEHFPEQFRRIRDAYESVQRQIQWRQLETSDDAENLPDELFRVATDGEQPPPADLPDNADLSVPVPNDRDPESNRRRQAEENIDVAWSRAIRHGADWQVVYRQLARAAARATTDEILFCRLYWLLRVAPQVDAARKPIDWLAAGLARSTATPRLLSLYMQELNRRPEEALQERSRDLLTQSRPNWQLSELARQRWRALRKLNRTEEIAIDIRLLSGPLLFDREEWVQSMMAAVEVLIWSEGNVHDKLMKECLHEIDEAQDVQLGLTAALDRHELLQAVGLDFRRCRENYFDNPSFPKDVLQLIPELWLNFDAARWRLVEILGSWVDHPHVALDGLDGLNGVCRAGLSFIADVLTSLAPCDREDAVGSRRRSIEYLIESYDWTAYRARRRQLYQYCLRTGIWVEDILDVMHSSYQFMMLATGPASMSLREDLPLKCLLAGHRAFWR